MYEITTIKRQVRNENRVSIFVDGKYSFSLALDQLLAQKLKKGDQLDNVQLEYLQKLSAEGKLKARALEWLLTRPRSTKEFRDYLYRKKTDVALIKQWSAEFQEKNVLSDELFSRWFVENRLRKHKSQREIVAELRSKDVSRETIEHVVTELGLASQEHESIDALVNKLRKRPRYQDTKKLTEHLLRKGFSYAHVKESFSRLEIS